MSDRNPPATNEPPHGTDVGGLLAALRVPEFKRGIMALLEDPRRAGELGMVKSAVGAATLPADVYAGKVDPVSDEGISRGFDLAGFLAGQAPLTAQAGAAGIFGAGLPRLLTDCSRPC